MAIYCTEQVYVYSVTDLAARLSRIDAIILALETMMGDSGAATATIAGYSLDDGQTKIATTYRDIGAVAMAIDKWDTIRERIFNKLNGRTMALRNWEGLR